MKKRNAIFRTVIASAVLAVVGSAYASGTLTGTAASIFATQNFGATSTAAAEIVPGAVSYVFNTPGGIVINPAGVINMYFRLGNGATFTAAPAAAEFSTSSIAMVLGMTVGAPTLSTDKTTIVVPFSNATAVNITIGVGGTAKWVPVATKAVSTVNTVLNTVGGVVTASGSASVLAALAGAGMNATVALPADVDGPATPAATIATAASAITATVTATGATETQKIDVTASPSQTKTTTGVNTASLTIVNFGSYAFADVAGPLAVDGVTPYTVASQYGAAAGGAVATGNFGAAGTVNLFTNPACTAAVAAGNVGVLNVGKTTATFTGVTKAATGIATYVCYTVNGTAAIPVTTPTLTTSLTPTTTTHATPAGSGTLYALGLNGASVDVRSYIPAAATGYASYVRIVNTGSTLSPISVAVIDQTTGVAGTSAVLGTLAAGAAKTYLASDIETAVGALAANARPRLRITAPTSSIQVQSFMSSPNGTFTDMSGGQLSNPTGVTITGN